ncbi:DUF805 domain-containing protein [Dongia sedimenti]|uniref:DUF805 domain-containing protein n=1 Tax=Dongia sedimenti TaxID=3064282 RepID=A0ABU0YLV5_9PROT|nr:DUF805 domain-containing protein [Rhodospirillaceae bacterium R-7]
MLEGYFALSGRLRRWRFFLYGLVLWIIIPVLILLAIPAVGNARYPFAASLIAVVAIGAFWCWAGMALVVKRLHDLNRSGWHYVWMFLLPGLLGGGLSFDWSRGQWSIGYSQAGGIIPLLALLYLIFGRGSDGPNDYGYPP